MIIKLELCILGVLKVLGHHSPFRTLKSTANISTEQHCVFFHLFIDQIYSIKHEFIAYPSSAKDLEAVMNRCMENYIPGCGGSVNVVHVNGANVLQAMSIMPLEKRAFILWFLRLLLVLIVKSWELPWHTLVLIMISKLCMRMKQFSSSGMVSTVVWNGRVTMSMVMKRQTLEYIPFVMGEICIGLNSSVHLNTRQWVQEKVFSTKIWKCSKRYWVRFWNNEEEVEDSQSWHLYQWHAGYQESVHCLSYVTQ